MPPLRIFISYSHVDTAHKEALVRHLRVLGPSAIDAWDDSRIALGGDWQKEIEQALAAADVAVLLVTTDFLISEFIQENEVPRILERHQTDLIVVPVIARHCLWQEKDWLRKIHLFNNGLPIWRGVGVEGKPENVDLDLTNLTDDIAKLVRKVTGAGPDAPDAPAAPQYVQVLFVAAPSAEAGAVTALLDSLRGEIGRQEGGAAHRLICYAKRDGVVVATFSEADDPAALFRFTREAASALAARGLRPPMGLCAVLVEPDEVTDLSGVPSKAVDLARRLARLAHGGQILSAVGPDRLLAGAGGDAAPETALFHPVNGVRVWPAKPVTVYNVYGTGFGEAMQPQMSLPERVILGARAPSALLETRERKLKINFAPDVPYAEVRFEFEPRGESEVRVTGGKPAVEPNTFEFDFENGNESRTQSFEVCLFRRADMARVILKVVCRDRSGEVIGQPLEKGVNLSKGWLSYLTDLLWEYPWYVRGVPAALAGLLCLLVFWVTRPAAGPPVTPLVPAPEPLIQGDVAYQECDDEADLRKYWGLPAGEEVSVVTEEAGPTGLALKGPRLLLLNPGNLKGKFVYDFKVTFALKLKPETTLIGWKFRTGPGGGYVFILEKKPSGNLVLHGTYEENDAPLTPEEYDRLGPARPVNVGAYSTDDWIKITADVNEYTFGHVAQIISGTIGKADGPQQPVDEFYDKERRFRYGDIGLWVPAGNEAVLDYWRPDFPAPHKPNAPANANAPTTPQPSTPQP